MHQVQQALCRGRGHLQRSLATDTPDIQPGNVAHSSLLAALRCCDEALSDVAELRWLAFMGVNFSTESTARPGQTKAGNHMNQSGREPMVFVVDDDPSVRRALERLLKSVGLAIRTFPSARDFLESSLPDTPACIVLDVRMPRMSGLDLQREISRRGIIIPIIFITGHGDINMAVQAMKDGAVDFLPKPFQDQDLLDSINRALERFSLLQSARSEADAIWDRIDRLTPRERQVMELVITGMLNKQVAGVLGTSEKTVKVHRGRVMEKMQVPSLAELVRLVGKVGIEGPEDPTTSA